MKCVATPLARAVSITIAASFKPVGQGLVYDRVLAALHGRHADHPVQMIGRHDLDRVHVFFLLEQLAQIGVRGAALEYRPEALSAA